MKLPVDYTNLTWQKRRLVRNAYIEKQKGKCYFCNTPLLEEPPKEVQNKSIQWDLFPPNFLKYPIHLQHCHKTGLTEGAVHALCNAVLWQYHGR